MLYYKYYQNFCKTNFFGRNIFIGESATQSWEKSCCFKYGSYEDFFSKDKKKRMWGEGWSL